MLDQFVDDLAWYMLADSPTVKPKRDCSVEFRGKTYKSRPACCEAFDVSGGVINYRIRTYNESFQEAMEYYLNGGGRDHSVEFRGKTYKSKKHCCGAFDVSRYVVSARIYKHNESFQKAMEYYLNGGGRNYSVEFRGKTYPTKKACCEVFGFKYDTVNNRMNIHNESFQTSLEYYIRGNGHRTKFQGKTYTSKTACCKAFDVSYYVVRNRMTIHNESFQEAMEYYLNGGGRSIELRGKTYPTKKACCKALGVHTSTVWHRMKNKNEKLEESLEHYLKLESK